MKRSAWGFVVHTPLLYEERAKLIPRHNPQSSSLAFGFARFPTAGPLVMTLQLKSTWPSSAVDFNCRVMPNRPAAGAGLKDECGGRVLESLAESCEDAFLVIALREVDTKFHSPIRG